MAPPVIHRQTAATPRAPLLMTATAAMTARTTARPPLPPPHPQTALTQAAAATQIRGLRRGRRRRNEQMDSWSFIVCSVMAGWVCVGHL